MSGHLARFIDRPTPEAYCCSSCGRWGVKLWRDKSKQHEHTYFYCARCLIARHREIEMVSAEAPGAENEVPTYFDHHEPAYPRDEGTNDNSNRSQKAQEWWLRLPNL